MTEIFRVNGHRGYIFQGVFFTEGRPEVASPISECTTSSNVQNTNMDWLREQLANQVKQKGGNALIGFSYVQKANVWSFSSVTWKASGTAATIANLESWRDSEPNLEKSSKKNCEYCGEEILAVAKKCRYCGEMLT